MTPQEACAGAGSWLDLGREEPTLELPVPEGLTLRKGPALGQCMKNPLEKFLEGFSRGRNPRWSRGGV